MSPTNRYVYVFLHIPKTGGTTINAHLYHHLRWDEEFVHLAGWGDHYREKTGRPPIAERSAGERAKIRVIAGHRGRHGMGELIAEGKIARYLTVLRDPADRIVSVYNYRMGKEPLVPFWDWYETYPRNVASKWLRKQLPGSQTTDDILKALRTFWFVGTTEHLDDDLPHVFRALGVPETWEDRRVAGLDSGIADLEHHPDANRVIPRYITVDDRIRQQVHADHRKDLRLYRFAQRRRTRMRWDR